MADIKSEPVSLIVKRIDAKLAEFAYNLTRLELRKEEMEFEMEKLNDNEAAIKTAIADLSAQKKEILGGK